MKLSKNFSLNEMIKSDTATRKCIDNNPSLESIQSLTCLCEHILQPIREALGPVNISSGYRAPDLNKAIGGGSTSQHCAQDGNAAADFQVKGVSVEGVYQWIKASKIPYDQLIQEFDGWVHISYNRTKVPRQENLRATKENGKTKYTHD